MSGAGSLIAIICLSGPGALSMAKFQPLHWQQMTVPLP